MASSAGHLRSTSETQTQAQTIALFARAADEPDERRRRQLLDDITVLNIPVAHSIARRFRDRGCAIEDLEQAACVALVKAVRGYAPERGHHFLAYAVPSITGAVKRHFRDSGWMVRPPRSVQELQQQVDAARRQIDPATGQHPDDDQVAATLGVEPGAVTEALAALGCFSPTSLDLTVGEDSHTLADLLVSPDSGQVAAVEARMVLRPALATLNHSDLAVLRMRYVEELTQQEIATRLGVTQPVVSRMLSRILDAMASTLGVGTTRPAPAA